MNRWKSLIYVAAIAISELLVLALLPLLVLARAAYSLARRPRFSIWTGTPILTLSRKAAAERRLGVRAITIVRRAYYVSNDFDIDLFRLARGNLFVSLALTYLAFLWVCISAKRVHSFADGGLLPNPQPWQFSAVELKLYKWLRIQQFIWVYGADVRTRDATLRLGQPNCCTDCTQVKVACICDAEKAQRNMQRLSRNAVAVFSMGDMVEYTPASRNNLFFWPLNLEANGGERYRPIYPPASAGRKLRVIHAPNHRMFKGTAYLEAAVARLQQQGIEIELVLVEKVPNAEALGIYRSADLVFDQCMVGFHGYFALEAMALGKPVMCFIRDPGTYLLAPEECPIINTHLTSLEQDLRHYAQEGRASLPVLGRRGRQYIERYYTEQAFAERLGQTYNVLKVN